MLTHTRTLLTAVVDSVHSVVNGLKAIIELQEKQRHSGRRGRPKLAITEEYLL